ncbi:MAG: histidine kinase [Prosthecobacter sp.]|nr:histidine kinase [Prosthecobacter sp.]
MNRPASGSRPSPAFTLMIPTIAPKPQAAPHNVNALLADYLGTQKEGIINEWLERVRGDAAIMATASLNTNALKDHLPEIFDDLTETLRRYGSEAVAEQSTKDAEEHGATRLRQGYELPEMLRELMHLRSILIYHMLQFEGLDSEFGMASRLFISTTLHRFIDEMMIDATDEYLWSQLSLQDQIHQGRKKW